MGVVPPAPGFLEGLRALCDASGALLVFDEVITGFRVARGGAQERYGVAARPDDPRQDRRRRPAARGVRRARRRDGAARAGRRRLPGGHALREPARDGRRAARCCAGCATRRVYERARAAAARGSSAGCARPRRGAVVQRVGAMVTLFCRDGPVRDFEDAAASDTERYAALFRHLLERGVYVAPSQFEAMFLSLAHGDDEIDRDGRGRWRLLRRLSSGTTLADAAAAREPRSGRTRCCRPRERDRRRSSRRSRDRAVRARGRDDLRGLPRALRPAARSSRRPTDERRCCSATTSTRTGSCAIADARRRRRRARPRRADLALRAAARRRRATATARRGRRRPRCSAAAGSRRRARALRDERRRRPAGRARARGGRRRRGRAGLAAHARLLG